MDASPEPGGGSAPGLHDSLSPLVDAEGRRLVRICLSALGVLGAGSLVGVGFSPYLVGHYPLILIALSPIGRHLILVAPTVDPVAFVAVAVVRRMLFYGPCFHLGRALGPAGVTWLEARAGRFARFVRVVERLFRRASHAVVFALPGPTVAALAGISGMRGVVFGTIATGGLVVRMLLIVAFGQWARAPIEAIVAWIDQYWVPATIVMVTGISAHQWWRRRRARSRPVEELPPSGA